MTYWPRKTWWHWTGSRSASWCSFSCAACFPIYRATWWVTSRTAWLLISAMKSTRGCNVYRCVSLIRAKPAVWWAAWRMISARCRPRLSIISSTLSRKALSWSARWSAWWFYIGGWRCFASLLFRWSVSLSNISVENWKKAAIWCRNASPMSLRIYRKRSAGFASLNRFSVKIMKSPVSVRSIRRVSARRWRRRGSRASFLRSSNLSRRLPSPRLFGTAVGALSTGNWPPVNWSRFWFTLLI